MDPIAFLQTLIRCPSCDPPGGELAVARLVHAQLQRLGIESHLDEFEPGRANVIGRVRGTGAKSALMFSAHMDTVPAGDLPWARDAFSGDVADGRIHGRGTSDMKSAIAAFIAAADLIQRRKTQLQGDIILAFTAGESANCLGARRMVAQGYRDQIGAFLCGEPSSNDIIVVEKAILWLKATAIGQIGHVSGAGGVSAILAMVDYITRLRSFALKTPVHPLLTPASITIGKITGGTAVNVTPDLCVAEIDVRFAPGISAAAVLDQFRADLPVGITLEIMDFKPAVEAAPDSPFVQTCARAIINQTGITPQIKGVSYYSDGAILLDGLDVPFAIVGPGDLGASGTANESAQISAIQNAVQIYAKIAIDWLA